MFISEKEEEFQAEQFASAKPLGVYQHQTSGLTVFNKTTREEPN
jgi:hypothetical protein